MGTMQELNTEYLKRAFRQAVNQVIPNQYDIPAKLGEYMRAVVDDCISTHDEINRPNLMETANRLFSGNPRLISEVQTQLVSVYKTFLEENTLS